MVRKATGLEVSVGPRVVSLVPSATEVVYLLGAGELLVGRSHECDYPGEARAVPALTGSTRVSAELTPGDIDRIVREGGGRDLYELDAAALLGLRPDVVITQSTCSVCSVDVGRVRAALRGSGAEILEVNPRAVEDVLDDILRISEAIGRAREGLEAMVRLRDRLFRAQEFVDPFSPGPRTVIMDWCDPMFVAGHWTSQLVERAGGEHGLNPTVAAPGTGMAVGPQQASRSAPPSRIISIQEVGAYDPERIVIAPCGVPLEDIPRHARLLTGQEWFKDLAASKGGRIALVDGSQMFSRPGPRLADALEWLVGWIWDRPELTPPGFAWRLLGPGEVRT